jgi:N-acyl-D-aspartate/D-glutamate deacylase
MAYELVIRGGTVVDGSEAPRRVADVAVQGGQVAAIGRVDERGAREVQADGLFVTPGFIDGHAHFDAQVFWDPCANSSSLHGVTTTIMGNCGFTLAPSPAESMDLAIRSIERAEDIARRDMEVGVPWTWRTYADYLDAVDALPKGINFAGYVGHSALRSFVMGERAYTDRATDDELAAMRAEVAAALAAGAIGFSTSRLTQHRTIDDGPVASFVAPWEEVRTLVDVLGERQAGIFQLAADIADPELQRELGAIAQTSGRPVHLACVHLAERPEAWRRGLAFLDATAAAGARAIGQAHVRALQNVIGFRVGLPFDRLPRWRALRAQSLEAQAAALRDPAQRADLVHEALHGPYVTTQVAAEVQARLPDYENLRALFASSGNNPSVAELARQRGTTPPDVMIDLSLDTDFDQFFTQPFANQDEGAVEAILRHPRTVIAQSDSGAHVSQIMDSSIPTYFLSHWVRERQAFSWEEGVSMLTARPAREWGLEGRGVLREGGVADLVVFDPERIAPCLPTAKADLPAGGTRLAQAAEGIRATVVAGQVLLEDGAFTEARPGRLIRGAGRPAL